MGRAYRRGKKVLSKIGGGLSKGLGKVKDAIGKVKDGAKSRGRGSKKDDNTSNGQRSSNNAERKSRSKPPKPLPEAQGRPHTRIEKPGKDGQYTTFRGDGSWKQYRGSGKPHGQIKRPNIKETRVDKRPSDGKEFIKTKIRKARTNEIPGVRK